MRGLAEYTASGLAMKPVMECLGNRRFELLIIARYVNFGLGLP